MKFAFLSCPHDEMQQEPCLRDKARKRNSAIGNFHCPRRESTNQFADDYLAMCSEGTKDHHCGTTIRYEEICRTQETKRKEESIMGL